MYDRFLNVACEGDLRIPTSGLCVFACLLTAEYAVKLAGRDDDLKVNRIFERAIFEHWAQKQIRLRCCNQAGEAGLR
jgi:hypothetical protein